MLLKASTDDFCYECFNGCFFKIVFYSFQKPRGEFCEMLECTEVLWREVLKARAFAAFLNA